MRQEAAYQVIVGGLGCHEAEDLLALDEIDEVLLAAAQPCDGAAVLDGVWALG
jgi:hypothetical protein